MLNSQASIIKYYPEIDIVPKPLVLPFFSSLKKVIQANDINLFLEQHQQSGVFAFIDAVLEYFDFSYNVLASQLDNIPAFGRLVIVANQPLGALDALSLVHLVKKVRRDIKIVVSDVLVEIEQIRPILLDVDDFGRVSKEEINQALSDEEVIIIFPSQGKIKSNKDGKWKKSFFKLVSKQTTPILPIYLKTKNRTHFYRFSSLNKALSIRKIFQEKNNALDFTIGKIIPYQNFLHDSLDFKVQVKLLKKHLYSIVKGKKGIFRTEKPIAKPENRQALKKELKMCELLGETKDAKKIYLYNYEKGSKLLQELTRLREYTARKLQEGTGKKRNKDSFDYYYNHIVIWDDKTLEIVGAYRIAESNYVYANFDKEGFCSHTSFRFQEDFLPYLNNSIELGKSFVQPKYWGKQVEDYLGQGINAYLSQNQHIKYIFGMIPLNTSLSQELKELILYYYDRYYGVKKNLLKVKNPFVHSKEREKELSLIFIGKNKSENFKILKEQFSYYNVIVPQLYERYVRLYEEGNISFLGHNVDKKNPNLVESFILIEIDKMKK